MQNVTLKHAKNYSFRGATYQQGTNYKVSDELAEELFTKRDDKDRAYFEQAKDTEAAVAPKVEQVVPGNNRGRRTTAEPKGVKKELHFGGKKDANPIEGLNDPGADGADAAAKTEGAEGDSVQV